MDHHKVLTPEHIFEHNQKWVEKVNAEDPDFIKDLAKAQHPSYLWIGCSDSRVPPEVITGLEPGELFVHRNIANMVVHTDINLLSDMEYAVRELKIKHIIVCGHYGCGGITAAVKGGTECSNVHNWLLNIKDVEAKNKDILQRFDTEEDKINRLCELNVLEQVEHVSQTLMVKNRWSSGGDLTIHGWMYDMRTGLLKDLEISVNGDTRK